jgi:hypothetical protein
MKTYLGFCTQSRTSDALKSKYGNHSILNSEQIAEVNVLSPCYENTKKLTERYNQLIKTYSNEDCVLVLTHDDLVITDKNWISKLHKSLETYDVVGLAGGSDATVTSPCLWHIMCTKRSGTVTHINISNNSTFNTYFGKNGRVLILDGIFLAFNPKKLYQQGITFDESNPCVAHFYDIDFSLTCNKNKLKLSTINISATHCSPGLREYTQDWLKGEAWFLNKFTSGGYYV